MLYGHQHSFEQNLLRCDWSPDGSRVAAGSSDRIVYIWDAGKHQVVAECGLQGPAHGPKEFPVLQPQRDMAHGLSK